MQLRRHRAADALYPRLDAGKVVESEQVAPIVVVVRDMRNRVVGAEVLNVSKRVTRPGSDPSRTAVPAFVREKPAKYGKQATLTANQRGIAL